MIRWIAVCIVGLLPAAKAAWAQSGDRVDFSRQVQPILAKRCFACHGPDRSEGGVRLDQKELALRKAESGALAIVPKQPHDSELIRRVTSMKDDERMPPEGAPLTESQTELLRQWIQQGAEWNEHWAFQPVRKVTIPKPNHKPWADNPIDALISSKLTEHGLSPAPPASKTALLRRVTYDLTGLPPTPAELEAFLADDSPQAYERVVDRLLASERFGEQWARHWLDVVRYADTNSFERDGPKPNAWRYRDYVIRSFNADKPYDRFILEQLAGDELPEQTNDGLIATGFYRLGLWDDEPADRVLAMYDGLDDIITTVSQGFLGLTVNCARCHDHKIDPISQQEYYSLLAFFQGVTPNGNPNPNVERPIFENEAARLEFAAKVKAHQEQIDSLQARIQPIEQEFRDRAAQRSETLSHPDLAEVRYRFYRDTWDRLPDFDALKAESDGVLDPPVFDISPATREFSFGFVFTGLLQVPADGEYSFRLDSDDGSRLTVAGKEVLLHDGIHGTGQPKTAKLTLKRGQIPIRVDYFQGSVGAKDLIVQWSGPGFDWRFLSKPKGVDLKNFTKAIRQEGEAVLGKQRFQEYVSLTKEQEELRGAAPKPDMALCVTEAGPAPPSTFVLKRGNPATPGDEVVPAFLSILGGGQAKLPATQSTESSGRRLALAQWIASPENRLTSRVMVNRLWQHYFGRGIVRSPNNFGRLGDQPTHLELLDWLAGQLVKSGWRLKPLHKLIVMSQTYRMSSAGNATALAKDPLNNLFWRHDMRRLSAEEIRDSILEVNGRLNHKMYGPGVYPEISDEVKAGQSVPGAGWLQSPPEDQVRRSIYIHVKRSLTFPLLAEFDFPDTDTSCAARFTTTQPTQALGMLNGKFLNDEARALAVRLRQEEGADVRGQVALGFRLTLNREPEAETIDRGVKLIETLRAKQGLSAERALDQFCLMVLNLNEFIYLD